MLPPLFGVTLHIFSFSEIVENISCSIKYIISCNTHIANKIISNFVVYYILKHPETKSNYSETILTFKKRNNKMRTTNYDILKSFSKDAKEKEKKKSKDINYR